jgi:hypothetical protein
MRFFLIMSVAVATVPVFISRASAGGNPEITAMPIGSAVVQQGTHDVSYKLPTGPGGPLPQALVLIAGQPRPQEKPTSSPADEAREKKEEPKDQVPAVVKFTVAGQQLPDWQLQKDPTAYVINLQTLRKNPEYQAGRVAIKIELDTIAASLGLVVLGMPDPLLLDDSKDGPLGSFAEAATDAEVKAYFGALAQEIAGQKESARAEYEKLRAAKNDRVARFARRGLRMLSYELRTRRLSGNLMEHYRWGLYLQQCGLFAAAYQEFEECRIIQPAHGESQFRAAEMLDHEGGDLISVLHYLERSAEADRNPNATDFYVLLTILKSRGDKTLTLEEIDKVRSDWLYVEKVILAATRANVRIWTSYFEIGSEQDQAYTTYGDGVSGPAENIIQTRGWFDSVISVRPRLSGDKEPPVMTVGGDLGPQGASLSALYHDSAWTDYLKAWNQQAAWAINVGEIGPNPPLVVNAIACGNQPIPYEGYGLRSALRYDVPSAMIRRLNVAEESVPGSYVQLWKIEGPYPVADKPPADGLPPHHVMDPIPAGPATKTIELVAGSDFIDLGELFPNAGWARAQATSWVFSPSDQDARMWLGQNDGMAVWLNGRCIHEGRYYSAGKYEDNNLVDTIAASAGFRRGWNELRVVVEAWPAPRDKGWGFSVRFCGKNNKPISGMACVNRRPEADLVPPYAAPKVGAYYSWNKVRGDLYESLPRLTAADLQTITGVKDVGISGAVQGDVGHVVVAAPGRPQSATYRPLAEPWQPAKDRDWVLNNLMDWSREDVAAFRYTRDGKPRDLLVLRPEAVEPYLLLLNEPPAAEATFGKVRPADRILGYVLIPAGFEEFSLLVVDALLADRDKWPIDEEDLMTPISSEYVPNRPVGERQPGPRP